MDSTSAPAVVAVVVTRDPGPWLEETLAALAAQDYPELIVVVLVAGGSEDPSARVGRVFPEAFVRRVEEPLSFGAGANEVLGMVEGAAFFLVCHDDCAPDPDAVRLMVTESLRANAGIVSPKMVSWDDPVVLVHVGMNSDKTGAVVDRVQSPEIDAGQHDVVREVFVAPSGCMLIRADLMAELGGFDAGIVAMAEDLDLCWRAQVAGSRVVVAPEARVRHLEVIAPGVLPELRGPDAGATLQALQRRHELRAVLKCYSGIHLVRVLPQIFALNLGEVLVALVARDRPRARAVLNAWRWNLAHRAELAKARRVVQRSRRVSDATLRRNQLRGSARLSEYLSNVSHLGFELTHARVGSLRDEARGEEPELTGSIAGAFSEDDTFDEDWDDRGRFAGRPRPRSRVLATRRSRVLSALVVLVVLLLGARDLLSSALPSLGQFVTPLSWGSTWHQFLASWHPTGVGTTAPPSPSFAALGALGTVFFGSMGLAHKVLVLGTLPVGAWGVSRLLAPLGSARARLVGAIAYLGLPLAYNGIARGRLDGLVAFALMPWVLSTLMRSSGLGRYVSGLGRHGRRRSMSFLGLGVVLAIGIAFAPAMAVMALVGALGLWLPSLVVGHRDEADRMVRFATGAVLVALVLCLPWVIGTVLSGSHVLSVFGLPSALPSAPSFGALLRFDVGPIGGSALSWLLPAAALLVLAIGSGPRLLWAIRLWSVALLSWILAWVVVRGWTHSFAPSIDVVLAPAAVAIAASVGLGVAAFETDLFGHRFGWRQLTAAVMMMVATIGVVPVLAEIPNGSFGLPTTSFDEPLQFLSAKPPDSSRVLWIGDPAALPLGSWSLGPGLAYATSETGLPNSADLYAPASPGPAFQLARALQLARRNQTVHLGRLLAPAAIRYVVVVQALAPAIPGVQSAPSYPVPANLLSALFQQSDLHEILGGEGFAVFANSVALPERAWRHSGPIVGTAASSGVAAGVALPTVGDLAHWTPVLSGTPGAQGYFGPISAGTLYAGVAPGGSFSLSVSGHPAPSMPAFSWATQFRVARGGQGALRFVGWPLSGIGGLAELVAWIAVVLVLIDRRFSVRARLHALVVARPSETIVPPVAPAHEQRAPRSGGRTNVT